MRHNPTGSSERAPGMKHESSTPVGLPAVGPEDEEVEAASVGVAVVGSTFSVEVILLRMLIAKAIWAGSFSSTWVSMLWNLSGSMSEKLASGSAETKVVGVFLLSMCLGVC